MEYVDGLSITEHADRFRLSVRERVVLFRSVCDAVAYAHQKLVIHRDLKPTNILVTADGVAKLLDFGIAKLVTAGGREASSLTTPFLSPGTPQYASPEQFEGEAVDTSTDVYSLGVVLHELLVGRLPVSFDGDPTRFRPPSSSANAALQQSAERGRPSATLMAIAAARRTTPEQLLRTLRGDLDAIAVKALASNTMERYRSPADLSEDLARHIEHVPVVARPRTFLYVLRGLVRRNRVASSLGLLSAVMLIAGLIGTYSQWRRAEAERSLVTRRFEGLRGLATSVFGLTSALQGSNSGAARDSLVANSLRYLEGLEQSAGGDTSLLREISTGYRQLGDAQRSGTKGARDAVLATYRRALNVSEQLSRSAPADAATRRELAVNYERVGSLLVETGVDQEGRENLQRSLKLYAEVMRADRTSATAQRDLLLAHLRYADAVAMTDAAAADGSYQQARLIAESLVARDPQSTQAARDLLVVSDRLRARNSAPSNSPEAREEEARFFEGVKDTDDVSRLEYFLHRFPDGEHAASAQSRLDAIKSGKSIRTGRLAATASKMPTASSPSVTVTESPRATPEPTAVSAKPSIPVEWKAIPAGRFQMGCDLRPDRICREDERPRHWISVSRAFSLLETEVTLGQYRAYSRATGSPIPEQPAWNTEDRQPMVNVTWDQAVQFCAAIAARLPTEAEWEWAAAGGNADVLYPWGDAYDRGKANSGFPGRDGWEKTSPVKTFTPNGYGLFDMVGNVWEWVGDWYGPGYYAGSPPLDPRGPSTGLSHVLRGGSYATSPAYLRITQRGVDTMDRRREATGFRCARDDR
jgi:formylglycine-generating enzyme required for sulfatase activity